MKTHSKMNQPGLELQSSLTVGMHPIIKGQSIIGVGNQSDAICELGGPAKPGNVVISDDQDATACILPCWAPAPANFTTNH